MQQRVATFERGRSARRSPRGVLSSSGPGLGSGARGGAQASAHGRRRLRLSGRPRSSRTREGGGGQRVGMSARCVAWRGVALRGGGGALWCSRARRQRLARLTARRAPRRAPSGGCRLGRPPAPRHCDAFPRVSSCATSVPTSPLSTARRMLPLRPMSKSTSGNEFSSHSVMAVRSVALSLASTTVR